VAATAGCGHSAPNIAQLFLGQFRGRRFARQDQVHDAVGVFGNPVGVFKHLNAEAGRRRQVVLLKDPRRVGSQALVEVIVGPRTADDLAPLVVPVVAFL